MINNFWNFSIGDVISGVGLLFVAYRIVSNHLWHLKKDLLGHIQKVEDKLDAHIKWHLEQKS